MSSTSYIFALGFFDGVHLGHQALLGACVTLARQLGIQTAAITFDRHPQSLFTPQPPALLTSLEDRRHLLAQYGMEKVHALPVTPGTMSTPWEQFLEELLALGAAGFVCGDDFRFGAKGAGNSEALRQFCRARDLPCTIVPEQTLDGVRISSSYIRRQLETGDMATALRFLGHPHVLTGTVVHGQRLGSRLGFPTANLLLPEDLTPPRFGVYACQALIDGQTYCAVTNVGTRPTVSGRGVTVESWILDFEGDLYGKAVTLMFHFFLRPERKFGSLEELRQQVVKNGEEVRKFFGKS